MNNRHDENVNKPALKKSKTVDENLDKLSSDFGIIFALISFGLEQGTLWSKSDNFDLCS